MEIRNMYLQHYKVPVSFPGITQDKISAGKTVKKALPYIDTTYASLVSM